MTWGPVEKEQARTAAARLREFTRMLVDFLDEDWRPTGTYQQTVMQEAFVLCSLMASRDHVMRAEKCAEIEREVRGA